MTHTAPDNTKPLSIAIAGLGTVGGGLLRLLNGNPPQSIFGAMRDRFQLAGVSARNRSKSRDDLPSDVAWFDDATRLADQPDIDVVVELIGGADGVARDLVETALTSGKHVVTANKALIAKHGIALASLADDHGVALRFEAAIAGAIPIVAGLRENAGAMQIDRMKRNPERYLQLYPDTDGNGSC